MNKHDDRIDQKIDPELLISNCYSRKREEVRKDFTPEELIQLKEEYFSLSNNQNSKKIIIEQVKALMETDLDKEEMQVEIGEIVVGQIGNTPLKELSKSLKRKLETINQGYEIVEIELFGFDYQNIGRMAFYDASGVFRFDRPLSPEEKQTTIHSIHKTA